MSLVLEALRRVDKPEGGAGALGASVPSYRPAASRRNPWPPLLLGLAAGGGLLLLFGPEPQPGAPVPAAASEAVPVRRLKGRAGLPPPLFLAGVDRGVRQAVGAKRRPPVELATKEAEPGLVLQAISERDSKPVAVINDQLVREGDFVGKVRILRIGLDSVDVILDGGTQGVVHFAAPPPEPSPPPSPSPEGI